MADPFYGSVVAQLHFNGSDASTTFTDEKGKTYTAAGNAQLDTAQLKWGTASGQFDGTTDVVTTPDHVDFQFGAGSFTIEFWVRFNSVTGTHVLLGKMATSASPAAPFLVYQNGTALQFFSSSNGSSWDIANAKSIGTVATGQWYHVAVSRSGSTWNCFLNGVLASGSPFTSSATVIDNGVALAIGAAVDASGGFNGWIDDLRITKGIARYTQAFTPPAEEFSDVLGDPVGDAAISFSLKTISASGLTGELGTGASNLPLKTGAGDGVVGTFGTLSATLPDLLLTGTALVDGYATVAETLPAKVISGAGLTGTVATAEIELPAKLLTALDFNSTDITLPALELESAGLTGTTASAAATLPTLTSDATGIAGILATSESTLPALVSAATGVGGTTGTAVVELPTLLLVAGGDHGADLTLPSLLISAAGVGGTVGTVASELPALTVAAGEHGARVELPLFTLDAAGVHGALATAELTLPMLRFSGAGLTGTVGTSALTLPALTLATVAYGEITGEAALALPLLQINATGQQSVAATFRTWVLNLRNRALTEYLGFEFNSYATLNGVVLGASADGIFVVGTEDLQDVDKINARVRTGKHNYDSSMQKRLPRIYSNMRAAGDMVFRTITVSGGTRGYLLPRNGRANDIEQRRVPIGKGPKSEHWQLELANRDGADFALDSLLVYPEELKRRVGP